MKSVDRYNLDFFKQNSIYLNSKKNQFYDKPGQERCRVISLKKMSDIHPIRIIRPFSRWLVASMFTIPMHIHAIYVVKKCTTILQRWYLILLYEVTNSSTVLKEGNERLAGGNLIFSILFVGFAISQVYKDT